MPSTWTDATERQLLFATIASCSGSPDWNKVAQTMGEGYTSRGVYQKFSKMKKALENGGGAKGDGGATIGKKTGAGVGKTTGGKRKAGEVVETENWDEDEEKVDSSVKKTKVEAEVDDHGEDKGDAEEEDDDLF